MSQQGLNRLEANRLRDERAERRDQRRDQEPTGHRRERHPPVNSRGQILLPPPPEVQPTETENLTNPRVSPDRSAADPPRTLQELAEAYPPRTSTDRSAATPELPEETQNIETPRVSSDRSAASPVFSTFSLLEDPEPRLSQDRTAAGIKKEENPH